MGYALLKNASGIYAGELLGESDYDTVEEATEAAYAVCSWRILNTPLPVKERPLPSENSSGYWEHLPKELAMEFLESGQLRVERARDFED